MALDVAEYLWNKFLKSLAELESESNSGSITISFFDSIKHLIKCFNSIKDVMEEIDIMPEPYTYSATIDVLYNLNDLLAECRIFTAECSELNKNLFRVKIRRMNFVKKKKNQVEEITKELRKLADPKMGTPQEESGESPAETEPPAKTEPEIFGLDTESKKIEGASSGSTRGTPQEESGESPAKTEPEIFGFDTESKKIEDLLVRGASSGSTRGNPQEESGESPAKTEPEIFGFDTESKEIEDLLVRGASSGSTRFTAIGVVGVAGAGKTTLVQKVLKREGVKKEFSPILWLPFYGKSEGEQQYSKLGFETCIQDKLGESPEKKIVGLVELLETLKQLVSGKKYLIVLDDVCHQNINIMRRLVSELPIDCDGSVIVTTRLKEVARKIGEQQHLIPVQAQNDVCSKIFKKIIPSDDESLLKKMEGQCHGLPLVAETLATYLPAA